MNPESIKLPHVNANGCATFLFSEFVVFDERGRILPITLAMKRIAFHVVDEFL